VLPLLTERNDTADDMAHYLHLKGKNLVTLTRFEEAIPLLQRLLQNQASIKEDKWLIPFSLAELAKAAIAQARWEDATSFVEQAKAFPSGYDFERVRRCGSSSTPDTHTACFSHQHARRRRRVDARHDTQEACVADHQEGLEPHLIRERIFNKPRYLIDR